MSGARHALMAIGDLSIHDYADNPRIRRGTNRMKKSVAAMNMMKCAPDLDEGDEQDGVEMQEGDDEEVLARLENDLPATRAESLKKKRKHCKSEVKSSSGTFKDYPFDVWMQVGIRVDPQDVGRFALICKKCHEVTNTTLFWKAIHKKHLEDKKHKSNISYFRKSNFFFRISIVRDICQFIEPFCQRKLTLDYLLGKKCHLVIGSTSTLLKFSKMEPLPKFNRFLVERLESLGDYMLVESRMEYFTFLEVICPLVPPLYNLLGKRLVNYSESKGNLQLNFSGNVTRSGQYQGEMVDLYFHKASYQVLNWWDYNFPAGHRYTVCPVQKKNIEKEHVPDNWDTCSDYDATVDHFSCE